MATVLTAINYYYALEAKRTTNFSKVEQELEEAARDSDMQSNDDYNLIYAMAAIACARGVATAQQAKNFLTKAAAFVNKINDKNANKEKANKLIEHDRKLLEAMTKTLWERLLGFLLGFGVGAVFTAAVIFGAFLALAEIMPNPHMSAINTFLQVMTNPIIFGTVVAGAAFIGMVLGFTGSRIGAGGLWENFKYAISNFFSRDPARQINSQMNEIRANTSLVAPIEMTNGSTWQSRLHASSSVSALSNATAVNNAPSVVSSVANSSALSTPIVAGSASTTSSEREELLQHARPTSNGLNT